MSLWTQARPASSSGPLLSDELRIRATRVSLARPDRHWPVASARFVLRSGGELARIPLERLRIDLPAQVRVPRDDSARCVELDDHAAHRDALVLGAIPIGVVEECLDSAGLLALAHRSPPLRTHHQYRWFRHPPCSIEQTLNADEAVQRTAPSPVLRSRLVLVGREGAVAVHALDIDLNDRQAAARC